ncbi:DnaJ C terminal domain-containing protein [Schizophyllum amplum]|uniref:DnaJ C terminal domain-containing protein n=1 Tax=Schizophyllum amplum TaxID=97359 RepID=A0A550C645_9AGAR|nr:DnaJ C terminal domain-containing protein [Auriculariopsis ampla]
MPAVPVETELYELLGVSVEGGGRYIKKAYRKKAMQHHPNIDDPDAGQKFQEIARRTLFAQFFEGSGMFFDFAVAPGMGRRKRQGEDSVIPYDVTLEDCIMANVQMNIQKECFAAYARVLVQGGSAKPKQCSKCEGKGWAFVQTAVSIHLIHSAPHESFERSGNDLLMHVTITLSEALLGFSRILVTHLDGRGVHVSSPPGKIIKPDDSIVLRGEGMPIYKRSDTKGDLYVLFEVEDAGSAVAETLTTIICQALASLLPPKRSNPEPAPEIVDEVKYEEIDIEDVRGRSYPAGADFFDSAGFQFGDGGDGDDWEDDDEDEDEDGHGEPECRPQ